MSVRSGDSQVRYGTVGQVSQSEDSSGHGTGFHGFVSCTVQVSRYGTDRSVTRYRSVQFTGHRQVRTVRYRSGQVSPTDSTGYRQFSFTGTVSGCQFQVQSTVQVQVRQSRQVSGQVRSVRVSVSVGRYGSTDGTGRSCTDRSVYGCQSGQSDSSVTVQVGVRYRPGQVNDSQRRCRSVSVSVRQTGRSRSGPRYGTGQDSTVRCHKTGQVQVDGFSQGSVTVQVRYSQVRSSQSGQVRCDSSVTVVSVQLTVRYGTVDRYRYR